MRIPSTSYRIRPEIRVILREMAAKKGWPLRLVIETAVSQMHDRETPPSKKGAKPK